MYYLLLSLLWTQDLGVRYFKAVLRRLIPISNADDVVVAFIYILLVLGAMSYLWKRLKLRDIAFYLVVCAVYLVSFYASSFTKVRSYLGSSVYEILLATVPCFFVGLAFGGERDLSILYKVSLISVVLEFFAIFVMGLDYFGLNAGADIMSNAYGLLPHLLLIYTVTLKKKSVLNIAATIAAFVLMVAYGTRGPIALALVYFVAAYILIYQKKIVVWRVAVIGLIFLVIIFAYAPILRFLEKIIDNLGMSTRFIDKILGGTILSTSGRDIIQKAMLNVAKDHPFGAGMAADRFSNFTYAHSIIYELWISYGIIAGSIVFGAISLTIAWGYVKARDTDWRVMILLLAFSNGYLKLFISSSYLLEHFFWMLLGVCVSSMRLRKHTDAVSQI